MKRDSANRTGDSASVKAAQCIAHKYVPTYSKEKSRFNISALSLGDSKRDRERFALHTRTSMGNEGGLMF